MTTRLKLFMILEKKLNYDPFFDKVFNYVCLSIRIFNYFVCDDKGLCLFEYFYYIF